MYAAKLDGEGAAMYDAIIALKDAMVKLEETIDGGEDSLSMAAQARGEAVKAPCNRIINSYVICPDITKTITPDLRYVTAHKNPIDYLIFKWHYDVGMLDMDT
ncbi:unnamed protein product [Sphagnum tenellum]